MLRILPEQMLFFCRRLFVKLSAFAKKLGNADKLLSLVGKEGRWDDETKEKFAKVMFDFSKVYNFRGGDRLDIKLGDAITVFMEVFGMDAMLEMSENDYNKNIINTWKELQQKGKSTR